MSTLKRITHALAFAGTLAVLGLIPTSSAQAQTAAKPPPGEVQSMTLWQLIKVGGWTMWPLGLFSVAAAALIIRNFIALKETKLLRPDIHPQLRQGMADRDVMGVRQLCDANPCLLTAVLNSGLDRVTTDEVDLVSISEAMEEASTEQLTAYMVPISYLSIIGVVSPMVGLLGTVSGMIKAFQNIAAGGMGKPEVLAGNIGEALVTTATGLIIAIPAMIFYFHFKGGFMKTMASMGRECGILMEALRTGQMPASSMSMQAETQPAAPATEA
jgi:biopolymer transport protein ExbB